MTTDPAPPTEKRRQQLQMVWPVARLQARLKPRVLPEYELRCFAPGDEEGFYKVMGLAGFPGWNQEMLKPWLLKILPDGWFVIVQRGSGELVATTMATHSPSDQHPFGGELGWVAAHPAHAGKGLGLATCTAVTARLLRAGYRNIYLRTDDFRLPAIKIYLKLGYVPFLDGDAEDYPSRWKAVCEKLQWPFPAL